MAHESIRKTFGMICREPSQNLPSEMTSSPRKRKQFSSSTLANDSSSDSFTNSNYVPSQSEGSSDSEFEEHPYSRSVKVARFDEVNIGFVAQSSSEQKSRFKSNLRLDETKLGNKFRRSCRSKCTSKNAVNARLNRLKKKQYIESLENKNCKLESENQLLKNLLNSRVKEVESLKKKALNLESVIRNKTEIGSLLKCVRQHTDLEISSSLIRSQTLNYPVPEESNHAENPSSSGNNDLEISPVEVEGNDILNFGSQLICSPLGFLDINDDAEVDFGISNPILSDVDSWFKPSQFDLPDSPESTGYGGSISPLRCETPSKGFIGGANKENLFSDVGVCFHIANNKVSLEFCDSCNHMASQ